MIDLVKFFSNPFVDSKISLDEIIAYATRHYSLMVANNPGNFLSTRIAATNNVLTAMDDSMTSNATKLAIRKAKVEAKDTFRKNLSSELAKIHGAVVAAFGLSAPELTECFPEGRAIYNSCRDDQIDDKLEALIQCITPYSAQIGAIHVTNATGLLSTWMTIYNALSTATSQTTGTQHTRKETRANLVKELYLNLLFIATQFPQQTDKCNLYCPQHLLENPAGPQVPDQPTLTIGNFDANAMTVPLSADTDDTDEVQFSRRADSEQNFTIIATVQVDSTGIATHVDTLPAFGTYIYTATGVNAQGNSIPSTEVTINAQ